MKTAWASSARAACHGQQVSDPPTWMEVTASWWALIDWQFSKVCQLQAWTFPPSEGVTECEVNMCWQAAGSHYCWSRSTHLSLTALTVCLHLSDSARLPCVTLTNSLADDAAVWDSTYILVYIHIYTHWLAFAQVFMYMSQNTYMRRGRQMIQIRRDMTTSNSNYSVHCVTGS